MRVLAGLGGFGAPYGPPLGPIDWGSPKKIMTENKVGLQYVNEDIPFIRNLHIDFK